MKKIVLLQMKNELDEIKSKDKINFAKKECKKEQLKLKNNNKKVIGANKVYFMIWQQILKNIKKDFFRVLIHVKCNENGDVFVWKIAIGKFIKKIIAVPVDIYLLLNLLNKDGLYTNVSKFSKAKGSDIILSIEVPRYCLENIIAKSEESISVKHKEMKTIY